MEQNNKALTKKLGRYLKVLREKKGISLNHFAYENDLTTATVSRIENGLVDTKISTLIKYARGLEGSRWKKFCLNLILTIHSRIECCFL